MTLNTFLAATAVGLLSAAAAQAQTSSSSDRGLDKRGIWTFQVENDATSTQRGTSDQYYTAGMRIGFTTGEDRVSETLGSLGRAVWGDGVQRISFDINQSIFTPKKTQLNPPDPHDEPYAAQLAMNLTLITDRADSRSTLGATLGVVGKAAGGQIVQNGFHSIIGDTPNRGWSSQLNDEPSIQINAGRTYRFALGRVGGIEFDTLPEGFVNAGITYDYAQLGFAFRFGQGLDSDYGTPRIIPGMSGTDAYHATRPLVWYAELGADGRAVAHNVFLDGNTFRSVSPHVSKKWDVGELVAGVGIIWRGVRVSYTQTWRTQEFNGQKSGLFNFGSLALSAKF